VAICRTDVLQTFLGTRSAGEGEGKGKGKIHPRTGNEGPEGE